MAWSGISPIRPYTLCVIWSHLRPHVFLPHLAALHPLSQTMGTTAVSQPTFLPCAPINSHQYHKSPLHGSYLFGRLLPIILFLHARGVF